MTSFEPTAQNAEHPTIAKKIKGPINISAYRLLLIFKSLCQSDELTQSQLNEALSSNPLVERTYSPETLGKYLHTLKRFGCDLERFERNGQVFYRLHSHPLKMQMSVPEYQALENIVLTLTRCPMGILSHRFARLVQNLCQLPAPHDEGLLTQFASAHFSMLGRKDYQLVEQFQRYCTESQVLEITYRGDDGQKVLKQIEPIEVISHKKHVYLLGKDPVTHKKQRFLISKIQSHRQLPLRAKPQSVKTTVMFKLSGRLVYNYRAYPGETTSYKGDFLLVSHVTDEVDQLLTRLLKYGPACQIVSPMSVRMEMQQLIQQLADTLDQPIEDISTLFNPD